MAPCLRQHPLASIDQDHGQIGGRCPGDHIAGVLLMARRVGDDELAALGGKESVGDIDRDALFAFSREAIEQQRKVEVATLGADLGRVGGEGGEMILEYQM